MKILIVEDSQDMSQLLEIVLADAGYETEIVCDGLKARARIRQRAMADLVLLDVGLPFVDGFELIEDFRADRHWSSVPLVVMTALSRKTDRHMAMELGASDFLHKPFAPHDVLTSVEAALRGALADGKSASVP